MEVATRPLHRFSCRLGRERVTRDPRTSAAGVGAVRVSKHRDFSVLVEQQGEVAGQREDSRGIAGERPESDRKRLVGRGIVALS